VQEGLGFGSGNYKNIFLLPRTSWSPFWPNQPPTLRTLFRLSPLYTGNGVKLTIHFYLIPIFWMCGAKHPQNVIRMSYQSLGESIGRFWIRIYYFPWVFNLLIHLNAKLSNSKCKLSYHRFPVKMAPKFLTTLIPQGLILISQVFMYKRKVVILECIMGTIR